MSDFEGKVVLFNYWASWCGPCQRELPGIDRVQVKLGGDNFEVVALNIDREGKPIALKFTRRLRLKNLKLYLDPKSLTARSLGLRAMPTTYMFDGIASFTDLEIENGSRKMNRMNITLSIAIAVVIAVVGAVVFFPTSDATTAPYSLRSR